jgi:hypothetical protein
VPSRTKLADFRQRPVGGCDQHGPVINDNRAAGSPLRQAAFRRVWIGATVSAAGDAASWVALVAYVLGPAHGSVPVLAALYTAPVAAGGLVAGWALDRYDRRWLLTANSLLRAAAFASTFVREIPDTRVFAATWWIDGDRPAIGTTERCKRPDIFWFNLIHEVGHVTLHARRESFLHLDTDQRLADPAEAEADSFAVETLFPGGTSDQIARASSQHELIILASRLGLGVPTVAGCYAKRTDNWRLVSGLRGTISDEDIAALEAAVNDNSGCSAP